MSKQEITILGTTRKRDINRDMYDYMPKYYEDLKEAANLVDQESAELKALNDDVRDVLDQFFIDTATWGLKSWERVCGIKTDESKPNEQRRSVIKSKLRGIGTVDAFLIKSVADSYTNGQVEVSEDFANYTIVVEFTSDYGRPPNIEDTKEALREIIPAHLAINFLYKYYTVDEVQAMTIDQIQAEVLNNFAPFE